ncbi:hypothetical protein B7494_g6817 [Chlorociboria aeruginascens]|nr:hypothetical protein B7494_g6817 [Chlorociboria aeruginascens]
MAVDNSDFQYFRYNPSIAAAVIFTVLFLLSSFIHVYQLFRKQTLYMIPLVLGGFLEGIGYIARIVSSQQTPNWTLGPYIIQTIFVLVAPALYAASIYMILGRIILLLNGEIHSLIKKRWLTKIFVACDILSFLVLAAGGGILAQGTQSSVTLGQNLILVGLFIQIVAFGVFVVVAFLFHKRIRSNPTHESLQPNVPWAKHLYVLYFVSLLIMVRSVVRVVEYIQGYKGYILSHEAFIYIFDATLMFIVVVVFNVVHPSQLTAGRKIVHEGHVTLESLSGGETVDMVNKS